MDGETRRHQALVDRLEPGQKPDGTTCIACVAALLRRWGFAPETTACGLVMHRCPFRDLAERFPSVVCALHAGLIEGALEELGAPVELEALERGVPSSRACLARLRHRAPAGDQADVDSATPVPGLPARAGRWPVHGLDRSDAV